MFERWTVSLPKDIQALLSGRMTVDDTTKSRVHTFLAEIGSPDRALLTCAVIAGQLATQNIKAVPALEVIKALAYRILNENALCSEEDFDAMSGEELGAHFMKVRHDLQILSEAMQMTSDAFGSGMARAGWLCNALSKQAYAHALIAETVAEAHIDSGKVLTKTMPCDLLSV